MLWLGMGTTTSAWTLVAESAGNVREGLEPLDTSDTSDTLGWIHRARCIHREGTSTLGMITTHFGPEKHIHCRNWVMLELEICSIYLFLFFWDFDEGWYFPVLSILYSSSALVFEGNSFWLKIIGCNMFLGLWLTSNIQPVRRSGQAY